MIVRKGVDARGLRREAWFSDDEKYRYWLKIELAREGARCLFIMLNPSTATELVNDPTITRCIGFAEAWGGYSTVGICNLFAFRATDPKELRRFAIKDCWPHATIPPGDPIGVDNDKCILDAAAVSDMIVCAWGQHGMMLGRDHVVCRMIEKSPAAPKLHYLRLTKKNGARHDSNGVPKNASKIPPKHETPHHPLYLPGNLQPVLWKRAA